jgi:ABC-type multidrug transport system ATPase subunit
MRQKVGIAIALAKKAEALLLDEPTSGFDPKAPNEFSALLNKLSGQGVAVLMATHDLFRAKESGTRVGIMKHGRLVAQMRADSRDRSYRPGEDFTSHTCTIKQRRITRVIDEPGLNCSPARTEILERALPPNGAEPSSCWLSTEY